MSGRNSFGPLAIALVLVVLATGGCARRRTAGSSAESSSAALFAEGVDAFHLGTPDAYRQAIGSFEAARRIAPDQCQYDLHLAQAAAFLAQELRLNFEDYDRFAILARQAMPESCPGMEAFRARVEAMLDYPSEAATSLVEQAVVADPQDPMNWVVYWKLHPIDGGESATERIEGLGAGSALIQHEVAQLLRRRGAFDRAREVYGNILVLNPRHYRSYLGLGHTAFESESGDAATLYREALRVEPAFLEGHHALGQYHAAIDQKDLALAAYEDALELNPGYYPVHFSMGMLLLDLGRSDEAELHFRRVVELDESNADAYYYLGNIQYSRRRFDWAQIQYELALAWQPDHVNAEYGFGKASQELGNLEEAFQRFDHVIEMAPRFPDGYFSRASVYSLREEYQLAVADYATTTLLGEREILLTESRIREAVGRGTAVARSDQRRLEDYKAHLEELLTYTGQNRTAIETYLRQVEEFRRARRTGSAQ